MRKQKSKPPLRPLIGLALFFFVLFFIIGFLSRAAKKSDCFRIKDILIRENDGSIGSIAPTEDLEAGFNSGLSSLKGRNIFAVDLEKEGRLVSQSFPGFKKIRFVKVLPERVFMDFTRRSPIAYVKLYRNFCVDEDAILFDLPKGIEPPDLPVISGLDTKIFPLKAGQKYNSREMLVALKIITKMKMNKRLRHLQIKKINVSDPTNISFLVLAQKTMPFECLEIKIGQEYIDDKINILSSLFSQTKNDWGNIKYIDLRFKESVIKLKSIENDR